MTRSLRVQAPPEAAVFWYNFCLMGKVRTLARSGLPGLPGRDCYPGELVLAIPHPFMFSGVFALLPPKDHPQ